MASLVRRMWIYEYHCPQCVKILGPSHIQDTQHGSVEQTGCTIMVHMAPVKKASNSNPNIAY